MTVRHIAEHWLLHELEEMEDFNPFHQSLLESDGFMLGLAIVVSVSALMSVALAIGDLSRFL